MRLVVTENWDDTLFYLATLSVVFVSGFFVRLVAG